MTALEIFGLIFCMLMLVAVAVLIGWLILALLDYWGWQDWPSSGGTVGQP